MTDRNKNQNQKGGTEVEKGRKEALLRRKAEQGILNARARTDRRIQKIRQEREEKMKKEEICDICGEPISRCPCEGGVLTSREKAKLAEEDDPMCEQYEDECDDCPGCDRDQKPLTSERSSEMKEMEKKSKTGALRPFSTKVGNTGRVEVFKHQSRSREQFLVVKGITERPDFNFACNGAATFYPDIQWKGPIMFTWYDKEGNLHGMRISWKGRILREVVA